MSSQTQEVDEELPPDPGTVPIPANHIRLWHYTYTENLPSIRVHGLSREHAKGETYGEPNQVWASAGTPKHEDFYTHNYVEFHVHPEQLDIGGFMGQHRHEDTPADDPRLQAHLKHLQSYGSHVTIRGDVSPANIIAIHQPWHAHLRYLRSNAEYYRQHPDFLHDDMGDPDVNRAVSAYKAEMHGKG